MNNPQNKEILEKFREKFPEEEVLSLINSQ